MNIQSLLVGIYKKKATPTVPPYLGHSHWLVPVGSSGLEFGRQRVALSNQLIGLPKLQILYTYRQHELKIEMLDR